MSSHPLVGILIGSESDRERMQPALEELAERGIPCELEVRSAHRQPDDNICFGVYLVDKLCLGVKNTFATAKFSPAHYQHEVQAIFGDTGPQACSPGLAYQMI